MKLNFVEYFEESSHTELNKDLIKNIFEISGETFDWMLEAGVPFEEELGISTSHSDKLYVGRLAAIKAVQDIK